MKLYQKMIKQASGFEGVRPLARIMKIPAQSLNDYLLDGVEPRIANLQKMADFFGVPIGALLEEAEAKSERPTAGTEGLSKQLLARSKTMENVPQVFNFGNQAIRTLIADDGEPWFVAQDVADTLGYSNTRDAIARHCKAAKPGVAFHDGSQNRIMTIIPERDVYRLVMRSKLPTAEKFEEWVVSEVLPSIRKTGGYIQTTPDMSDDEIMSKAVLIAQTTIENQKKEIAKLSPKAAIADRISIADGLHGFREVAKMLNVNERKFKKWLIANGWIHTQGRMKGMSDKIRAGYLEHKEKLIPTDDGEDKAVCEMFFTPKGLLRLTGIFNANPNLDFSFARR
jgi:anti-repressor protein